jgi:NAD(P)H-hydrate epimerase
MFVPGLHSYNLPMSNSIPRLYTAEQVREMDRCAIQDHGIEGIELMHRAGRALFEATRTHYPGHGNWLVFCGAGNNGGDGYVVARMAREAGMTASVCALRPVESLSGDAATAAQRWLEAGGAVQDWPVPEGLRFDLIVDALLGTGLTGPVRGDFAAAAEWINTSGVPVSAADIPSGLNADTGIGMGSTVKADLTVTFVGRKRGLYTADGPDFTGQLEFSNLQIPEEIGLSIADSGILIREYILRNHLRKRPRNSHKGSFGHVVAIGGNAGMSGAVRLCGEAALRSGAGKVTLATHPSHAPFINTHCPELMVKAVQDGNGMGDLPGQADILVVGTGLGQSSWSRDLFETAMELAVPMVIDADGLNLLATAQAGDIERLRNLAGRRILTPHPAEAGRLLGKSSSAIQADRVAAAQDLAVRYAAVVVLKGCGTVIADPHGNYAICALGNPGMATAGTGDVLAGVIAALAGQDADADVPSRLWTAALTGVVAHAAAGDLVAAQQGERGMLASDITGRLPAVLNPTR